jgi:glycosyltransferase involved in cell wall biosynthesis/SAM-dependent methyltransferase
MRIGIDYRMLSAGSSIVNRGMGRYTQQQIRAVLRIDSENEYILFCKPDANLSLILPEIRNALNVSIATIALSALGAENPNQPELVLRYAEAFQDWIYKQHVDVFHATTAFVFHDTVFSYFNACPMVVNFYDLIPLIFPEHYLNNPIIRERYPRALQFTQNADRLIAISQSARADAMNYLGFPANKIDVAYPIADPYFKVLSNDTIQRTLQSLRKRLPLPEQFVMSVTHFHHSKNLETLLSAYALVEPRLRHQLPLVITCALSDHEKAYIRELADKRGIVEDVVLTGFVSEEELAALYNAATLVVHPSRYEGFGLPVVEAMQCGAPVITTTSSSLPEAGGDAAVLIDPDDARGFADAIEALYTDPARRESMSQRGLEHVKKFDAAQLGQNTLSSYLQTARAHSPPNFAPTRPRLALWTPLPPQKSGIADYSIELLEHLIQKYEVEVFVDDGYLPSTELLSRYAIQHYHAFERRQAQMPFDCIIYQMGNSFFHFYMYDFIRERPGIIVLHDLLWGYVLYDYFSRNNEIEDFKNEIKVMEGPDAWREYKQIELLPEDDRAHALGIFLSEHYMINRFIDHNLALIVHMDWAKRELEAKYRNVNVHTVHMGVEDPWKRLPVLQTKIVRAQIGVKPKTFVVGVFGIVHPVKRIDVCLQAFRELCATFPDARLVIVGEPIDLTYNHVLKERAREWGINHQVYFAGHVTGSDFDTFLLACDVVINLRYPPRKQMSAVLVRAIAAGKPIIISDIPEWDFFPSDFCWRLAADEREAEVLSEYLQALADNPELRQHMSSSARAYFEREGTLAHMTAGYQAVIEQLAGLPARSQSDAAPAEAHARTQPTHALGFNKVCELEDFSDSELIQIMHEVFQHKLGTVPATDHADLMNPIYWETAMSIRALRYFGAIHADAVILGVGAGTDSLLYYLTNYVRQVFAADLYLAPHAWRTAPPTFMLTEPEIMAPGAFQRDRLVVQHMDGRVLHYADDSFDGLFASSSIEHLGTLEDIANAAYEMGRVLKPGGMLVLSTEYRISGPPGSSGWDACRILSPHELQRYIVEASGLELVDALDTTLSDATLSCWRDVTPDTNNSSVPMIQHGRYPRVGDWTWSSGTQLIRVQNGYSFCSIHLTLRKSENYSTAANIWARPSQTARESAAAHEVVTQQPSIRALRGLSQYADRAAISHDSATSITMPADTVRPVETGVRHQDTEVSQKLNDLYVAWDGARIRGWYNPILRRLPRALAGLGRTIIRVGQLGRIFEAQAMLYRELINHETRHGWRMAEFDGTLQALQARLSAVQELVGVLETQAERTDYQFQQVQVAQQQFVYRDDFLAQLTELNTRLAMLENYPIQQQAQLTELATRLEGRLIEFIDSQAQVNEQVKLNTSLVRLFQQQREIEHAGEAATLPVLSGGELIHLIETLEREIPELAKHTAIELSIQDNLAEETLANGAAHFGRRLSSAGETYRVPNDAWYHIDFTPHWNRKVLFESAATRLARDGHLIIVTAPEHEDIGSTNSLEVEANRILKLISGKNVRVYILRAG